MMTINEVDTILLPILRFPILSFCPILTPDGKNPLGKNGFEEQYLLKEASLDGVLP